MVQLLWCLTALKCLTLLLAQPLDPPCTRGMVSPKCCKQAEDELTQQYEWYLWENGLDTTGGELEMMRRHTYVPSELYIIMHIHKAYES
jgi:hypothetical protein